MTTAENSNDSARLRRSFLLATGFTLLLWVIELLELALAINLTGYGVFPRRLDGLIGILLAPLIHGSPAHLFANTLPLLTLGTALLYGYPRSSRLVIPAIYLGSGCGVWLFARGAYHIGASGLTFGLMSFVFTIGVLRRDRRSTVLSLLVFFLYGSMVWGVFPGDPSISYESHLAGALLGGLLALGLKHYDPLPPAKRYSWELEAEDGEMENDSSAPQAGSEGPHAAGRERNDDGSR